MVDLGLLVLRLVFGGLLAGHGAQKLFGWFGGYGLEGTSGWLESMGLRPGRRWAILAGASEFGGGALTLLGFLNPLGPIGFIGAMLMATRKVHWGKPIWVTSGGAELPVANMAAASAVAIAGPGKLSLDKVLGIRLPAWVFPAGVVAAVAGVEYGMSASRGQEEVPVEEAGGELIAHEQTEHEA
ncbi:MAG: DoxX family protein [Chloroflexota bacterium]|nr:DoxX family protein [Chloroflexota bacterium]